MISVRSLYAHLQFVHCYKQRHGISHIPHKKKQSQYGVSFLCFVYDQKEPLRTVMKYAKRKKNVEFLSILCLKGFFLSLFLLRSYCHL